MSVASQPRAVVTGGGSGLGRAFVIELAKRSASILVTDVDEASAQETAELARAHARAQSETGGADAKALRCDVSDADQVAALGEEMDGRFGGVDLVINNAGVAVAGDVGDVSIDDWRWIVGINLMGVVHGCSTFAPRLKKQGSGHIINVASAAGLVASPGLAPYNATKFAVVGLSEALFAELRPHGVGVTVLCPTFFPTNIHNSSRGTKPELKSFVHSLMQASKIDAAGVARAALASADAGKLYCLPMTDAKTMWALKRAAPEQWVARLGPKLMDAIRRKHG
jgi:NAD(P)-dependent dehydrogenase (short-subunit alcohol dehydrogenase family)